MRRVLQRDLMRGQWADRFATVLFLGLLMVLAAAFLDGVRHLSS